MTDWTELLVDPRSIRAIFGSTRPSLTGIELHKIELDRDGPTVRLHLHLPEFPVNPPKKWVERGCNRVWLKLQAIGVREVNIRGLVTEPTMDLTVFRNGDLVRVRGATDGMTLDLATDFLAIPSDSIGAYLHKPGWGW